MKRVEGDPNKFRDPISNAIINHDMNEYENYIQQKKIRKSQKQELDDLKNEISEIKSILKDLVNKQS